MNLCVPLEVRLFWRNTFWEKLLESPTLKPLTLAVEKVDAGQLAILLHLHDLPWAPELAVLMGPLSARTVHACCGLIRLGHL